MIDFKKKLDTSIVGGGYGSPIVDDGRQNRPEAVSLPKLSLDESKLGKDGELTYASLYGDTVPKGPVITAAQRKQAYAYRVRQIAVCIANAALERHKQFSSERINHVYTTSYHGIDRYEFSGTTKRINDTPSEVLEEAKNILRYLGYDIEDGDKSSILKIVIKEVKVMATSSSTDTSAEDAATGISIDTTH